MKLERTVLKTIVAALVFAIIAILLLVYGEGQERGWKHVLPIQVGSFMLASVVLALIFEFWQLRGLIEDLYEQAGITSEVKGAGIVGFTTKFYTQNWDRYFKTSRTLDVCVAYAATWRNAHEHDLVELLDKRDSRLRVILPDRNEPDLMQELARRFETDAATLINRIREAEKFYLSLGTNRQGEVHVFRFPRALVYTFYRFDDRVVFTSYKHGLGKGGRYAMIIGAKGGELYDWVDDECQGMIEASNEVQPGP